jgi:hypothetical protein
MTEVATMGFYWVRRASDRPAVIAWTDGGRIWEFTGAGGYNTGPVEVLAGPLQFEPEPYGGADTFVLMNALAAATRANVEMAANLTATQARCTELLDESRSKGREIKHLKDEVNNLISGCYDLSVKLEAERAAAQIARTEVQAQTIRRLRAIGYRVVKRCGACVSLAFERT